MYFNKATCKLFFSGLLCFFAFAPFHIFPILWCAYGYLAYKLILKAETPRQAYIWGHAFGFGYFLGGLYWIGNALLVEPEAFLIFTPFAYLGLPFALGAFYGLPAMLSVWFNRYLSFFFVKAVFLSLFLWGSDLLREFIFTGFPWNLPFHSMGLSIYLMQPIYYLTSDYYNLLIIFLGVMTCGYRLIYYRNIIPWMQGTLLISMVCISIFHMRIYPHQRISMQEDVIFRIIQPNIPQEIRWNEEQKFKHYKNLKGLSLYKLNKDKKYVFIWPETALNFDPEYNEKAKRDILNFLGPDNHLITGKLSYKTNPNRYRPEIYNSVFEFTPQGAINHLYDKMHLVPFGEYLPLQNFLNMIGFKQVGHLQAQFSSGTINHPIAFQDYKVGYQICYEIIFPEYSRSLKQQGADMIINMTNDAWFGYSTGPYQHLTQTRFRAVENHIPILRSANTGISAYIDEFGSVIQQIPLNHHGVIDIKRL